MDIRLALPAIVFLLRLNLALGILWVCQDYFGLEYENDSA
jgi:hypothetical protein